VTIVEHEGDLFDSDAGALGHGVNCKGLMGKGIARGFRERWPAMYEEYKLMCVEGLLKPGLVFPYRYGIYQYVINIATQEYPGPDASYEWVDAGVRNALAFCREREIPSLAVPRLGCGIGGLDWNLVRDRLEEASDEYPDVELEVWSL
jgi:O-acetyl-ADP-ribose deacetylase (regulator of RNase III)